MTCHKEQRKFLAAAAFGAAIAAAWSIPARADTARVRTIRVSETGGDTAIVIAASARPTFTTWKLEQPARVVVELSGARLGDVDVPLDAGTYAVGLVTASVTEDDSAGPRTRIVLTLRQASDYRVEAKGNDITLRVIPRVHPPAAPENVAEARTEAAARAKAEALARDEARAKERALAQARVETQARMEAQEQAKAEARAKTEVEAQMKAEARAQADAEAQAKAEAQARAKAEAQVKTEAQARANAEAQTKVEAHARAKAEVQAKVEAEARAKAEAQLKAEAQARAKTEEQARKEAQARAEVGTKMATQAKIEAEAHAQAQAKAEASAKSEKQARLAAQALAEEHARAEAQAKTESAGLRRELLEAHQETATARAMASAAAEESHRHKLALLQAEDLVKRTQGEAERARQRAESAELEVSTARQREADHDRSRRIAAEEVQARQKALDRISKLQEQQGSRLAEAERVVAKREATARETEAKLVKRDEEARAARGRRDGLARDASSQSKVQAAAAVAEAERQRKDAVHAAERSRLDLAMAVSARKQEEERKDEQAQQRRIEEGKLDQAVALRKDEESRLAEARAERTRLDGERAKLEGERVQLELARNALLAEVGRLKDAVAATQAVAAGPTKVKEEQSRTTAGAPVAVAPVAKPAPLAVAPAGKPAPLAAATKPQPAIGVSERPRSITLRALSHVRGIDFVDEPSRSSVIIDVEDGATFVVERVAGRRLSLRIDHSDLADGLERNLDATEYLGPVKIISSYREPGARSTVRVDVDLAEDVPNRIRQDGNRIFWDFEKSQAKAPSLPAVWIPAPAAMFVPARKVAGFIVTVTDALWQAQALPPYLDTPSQGAGRVPLQIPPEQTAPLTVDAPAASGAGAASAAQDARPGAGPSGRYATLGKKRYTGRRIDLDFKGADIHNILRLLADVGQVNIVVADDVKGDVTIKMRDVPWDQALDVVLRSKGLGSVREGNLLRVAPLSFLEKELEAEIARQKQIADVLPTETRLIGVSYADATHLQDKARDILSPRGKLSVDTRTNTLIVSDVSKNLQLIEDLVRNLDTQTSQVVIEARIVEANSNFTRQIGVQWGGSAFADTAHGNPTGLVFPYNLGIGGGADDPASPLSGLVPGPRTGTGAVAAGSPNFLVNMPASAGLGTGSAIGLTLGSVAGAFNLNLRLSAMENTGQVRVLSSPRVTTMDNLEARILQGVSIPVSVVSAMGAQTQFVDAQLSLSVKPHVTNEGTIAMTISVTNNAPDFSQLSANGTPAIDKKETKTTMLVRDGDTAVIGGIYTRNTSLSYTKVPYLSDIPILGWFFRSRKEGDTRSEFLVFITPRIVNRSRALGQ